jgi:UDP-glucose 4-epimerase
MKGHDMVWHLAASGDIKAGIEETNIDLKNNTVGTYNVLEAMRLNGIKKIVFSSSATYYGEQSGLMKEDAPPSPISLYGASKVAAEAFINAYVHLFHFEAWIYRFGNVIGGRMGHGVIYDFIHKLRRNPKELEIWGDGQQEKPYFLVEDCIEGMICGLNNKPDTYNLAPMTYTTVDEIAQIVIEEMGLKDVKLVHTPKPIWDAPIVRLDSTKIQKLGWKPSHTSSEAVRIATRRLLE